MLTIDDVLTAAEHLEGVAHRTPLLTSRTLDQRVGARVHLKGEHLQRIGAFKFRGAFHAVARLTDAERARGVATFSSGNHAQAIALAARLHGVPAVIVMPSDVPASKRAATLGYGAEVVDYDRYTQDRVAVGEQVAAERGMALIPPYDHPHVMAGQGTAALELCTDVDDLDVLVVCLGGGGLMAGCATAAKVLSPGIRVIGVEPEAGDDFRRSLAAGERVTIEVPRTIADGLQAAVPGALTFPIVRRLVDRVVTVTDAQIVDGMRFAFERLKAVLEPSGAVALAALLAGEVDVTGQRVGALLSGGNVSADRFAQLIARA